MIKKIKLLFVLLWLTLRRGRNYSWLLTTKHTDLAQEFLERFDGVSLEVTLLKSSLIKTESDFAKIVLEKRSLVEQVESLSNDKRVLKSSIDILKLENDQMAGVIARNFERVQAELRAANQQHISPVNTRG